MMLGVVVIVVVVVVGVPAAYLLTRGALAFADWLERWVMPPRG